MAQHHLAFLQSQAAHIEREIYNIEYGDIQFRRLVPVDTSANAYAGQVTWYTQDAVGQAEYLARAGTDFPMVDTRRTQQNVRIENLGIGYKWDEFELGQAMMLGQSLSSDRAEMVRRAADEKIDDIVLNGESRLGWDGLLNSSLITPSLASGSSQANRYWTAKTGQEIADDINNALSGIEEATLQTRMADTVLLDIGTRNLLATKQFSSASDTNILNWVLRNNVYTAETGRPLTIMTLRGLDSAATATGASGTGRMIVYQRNRQVLRLHMPMPLKFWAPQQHLLSYVVPAAFRLGGLEIRLPRAVRYVDGISAAP